MDMIWRSFLAYADGWLRLRGYFSRVALVVQARRHDRVQLGERRLVAVAVAAHEVA